ncbi:MAG: helix-turn-helix domain-containing protein [Verrucomicrobiota bacterium]
MLASVGQALREARLKKNLGVEEVSRATKIRAARILDLENDEYMRFPNITYARSFLVLYAKFLGVDITKYPTVEAGSTVGLAEYQYLQTDEAPPAQHKLQEPQQPPEKPRWLIAFFVFLLMLLLSAFAGWYVMNFRRLGSVENFVKKENGVVATPTPSPEPTAAPAPSPEAMVIPVPPSLNLPASPTPEPEVRRAEPVTTGSTDDAVLAEAAAAAATPAPAVFPPPGAVREIKVRVSKRIKVRIVRDNPRNSSLYYGFVNPAQPVLTYRGQYFWIKTSDPEALQVTIEGQPVTGPEAGVEIAQSPGL